MQELVWTLVVLLDLNLVDLVVAVHMIELCAHDHRGLFNVKILRSLFLTCCVISRKVNTDVRRVGDTSGPGFGSALHRAVCHRFAFAPAASTPRVRLHLTQEHINLRWCLRRLELAFTALNLCHLSALEKQTLMLLDSQGGIPSEGPYMHYAYALWDCASSVCSRPRFALGSASEARSRLSQVLGVQRELPELLVPWY